MTTQPYALVAIIVFVLFIVTIIVMARKREIKEPDYRALFWLGVAFIFVHIVSLFYGDSDTEMVFLVLGISYFAIGIANRDKWGKERKVLPPERRRMQIALMIALLGLVALGMVFFLLSA